MFAFLARRTVVAVAPRGCGLTSAAGDAFGVVCRAHAPWAPPSQQTSTSFFNSNALPKVVELGGTTFTNATARSFAASGACGITKATLVRTASGTKRVCAFPTNQIISTQRRTDSFAMGSKGAARVGGVVPVASKVPINKALATPNPRRWYYNNSSVNSFRHPPPATPRFDGEQMLWTLIASNTFIFFLWHSVDPRFMKSNFTVSEASMYTGRVHTAVTAAFSHYDFSHYASNMLALYYFGRNIGSLMGGTFLLNLYLTGGVVASLTHVAWCRYEREKRNTDRFGRKRGVLQQAGRWMENTQDRMGNQSWRFTPPALGASGAVNAVVFLNAALFPFQTIYLNFFIPMPKILFAGMFLARDLYGAQMGMGGSGTGHAAHLGGAAVGAVAWGAMRIGAFRRGGFRGR